MAQQEWDTFKERMRRWMSDNADTYDEFEELMNAQSDTGYQRIMAEAMALVPKYGKAVSKKMNISDVEDTLDIEVLFADEKLGAKLVGEFENARKESIVPAAMCWLFFGRSFENMVERGEEIMNSPNVSRLQSFIVASTTKLLIKKSIDLDLRTRGDWDEYNRLKKTIDSGQVMDWALAQQDDTEPQALPLRKAESPSTLESMLLLDGEQKSILMNKIGDYLGSGVKGKRVAFMILALRQLGYLPEITSDRQLFVAIKAHFNTYIGSDKSIYAYLDGSTSKQFTTEIDNLATYFDVDYRSIINDAVEYIPRKTKEDRPITVRVPLNATAKRLIAKYQDYSRDTLFPFGTEQHYNRKIKDAFHRAGLDRIVTVMDQQTRQEVHKPLYEVASSHMARRTFIGNIYKKVKDPNLVGSLSGHKEGSKAFARYRDIDEEMKRELIGFLD